MIKSLPNSSITPRLLVCFFAYFLVLGLVIDVEAKQGSDYTVFIAGDAIITQKWSDTQDKNFTDMVGQIRAADAAIINLEVLIHEFKGYAQANSGGTYMAAPPVIADELAWAGIDMVGNANNHSFDYGSIGVLETIENTEKAGIKIAGVGKDLQRARMPVYYENNGRRIGLISNASTFTPYGVASRSRPDLHGRPGLNPLAVDFSPKAVISKESAARLAEFAEKEGIEGITVSSTRMRFMGTSIPIGTENTYDAAPRVNEADLQGNLASIREAKNNADIVAMSIHAHRQGEWLTKFAHQAIDEGVDIFFVHGPHEIRGIEIYKGKPIFYSLGDFVFQNEQVEKFPVEFYDRYGLGDDATPEQAQNTRSRNGTRGFPSRREPWESVVALVNFKGETISEIILIPLDLGFGKPVPIRGKPKLADKELGKYIIEYTIEKSKPYGTKITYNQEKNIGIIKINN